jgi:hypothetical protein
VKPVLDWIKSNPMIVVFSALIVLLLPASWFVSSMWSQKIRDTQQKLANDDMGKLQKAKIDYTAKLYEPGATALSFKEVPNRALIKFFKDHADDMAKQAGDLVTRAENYNKGVGPDAQAVGRSEHKPLVDGLFPPPKAKDEEQSKLNEMEDTLLGLKGRPNPYQQLLDGIRAGGPTDPVRLEETIQNLQTREKEKVTANKRDLTADETNDLIKQLADRRLAEYQSRVSAVSVYAALDVFPHGKSPGAIPVGSHIDPDLIEPVRFFGYQWDYWVLDDLLGAVKLANTQNGKLTNVDKSIVKRIVSIEIEPPDGLDEGDDADSARRREMAGGGGGGAPAAVPGMAPSDPFKSISGRLGGPSNTVYDVRRAKMTVIVSSAHLQEFLEAIPRTNFMTITELNLAEVNVWDDLKKGFLYGPDHVVKATVAVETVWLRSWMAGYMPARLKAAFKIPEPQATPEAAPAAPAPPATKRGPG